MKRRFFIILLALLLTACGQEKESHQGAVYMNITAEQAKEIMDTEEGYIILDVRTAEEYAQGYIPGAVLLPLDDVRERAEQVLPAKDQLLLVYCRSGRRSKEACQILVELGYTNIKEFGGILDWPYEVQQ